MSTGEILASGGLGLVGVLVGWLLSQQTARQQRRWDERQTVRQRQDEVAAKFDARLVEIIAVTPRVLMDARDAVEPLREARRRYSEALTMTTILSGGELDDRLYALDMALFVAAQEAKSAARRADQLLATRDRLPRWQRFRNASRCRLLSSRLQRNCSALARAPRRWTNYRPNCGVGKSIGTRPTTQEATVLFTEPKCQPWDRSRGRRSCRRRRTACGCCRPDRGARSRVHDRLVQP
jgi:hypothetical protein